MVAPWPGFLTTSWITCAAVWTSPAQAAGNLRTPSARKLGIPKTRSPELDKAEAEEYRHQFTELDTDSNGQITADELAKAWAASQQAAEATAAEAPEAEAETREREVSRAAEAPEEAEADDVANSTEPDLFNMLPKQVRVAGKSIATHLAHDVRRQVRAFFGQEFGKRDLVFVHVPTNFGQTVERVALEGNREQETPFILYGSFNAKKTKEQWEQINSVKGLGGQVWGQMVPTLRTTSNLTGCNLAFEPPKYWPEEFARNYFGDSRAFGLVRDPYDRLVSEFRQQASGGGRAAGNERRSAISEREGSLEREGPAYQSYYSNCDVNAWLKEELRRFKAGDHFRGNCHLLPQAEYFEHPHGITLPIDTRTIPESFNVEMERHGYPFRMRTEAIRHNWSCNKLSAWDLNEESKRLIREVYAADFDLLCRHFGYCDSEELTCLAQVPFMCGPATSKRS